ncbi:hypothetical protein Tco_0663852 [Tanacetum coccineum]
MAQSVLYGSAHRPLRLLSLDDNEYQLSRCQSVVIANGVCLMLSYLIDTPQSLRSSQVKARIGACSASALSSGKRSLPFSPQFKLDSFLIDAHPAKRTVLLLTNKTGAPQGEELGLKKPLSESSCNCSDNSFISDGANRYGARATGAAPGLVDVNLPVDARGRYLASPWEIILKILCMIVYVLYLFPFDLSSSFWRDICAYKDLAYLGHVPSLSF